MIIPLPRILHVDINSYFATLLQQENPALRGQPIGVVKDHNRTCIIAASKEAKVYGVKTGCSLSQALELCPTLVTVPAEFDLYLSSTVKLKQLFEDLAPKVQIFSLDEAFIDITECGQLYPDAGEFARLVQARIKTTLGEWVSCNVGISYNRLLAKLTSEVSAKGSITQVTVLNRDALLAQVPFEAVCGVGRRLGKKLQALGVSTPYQINFITDQELEQFFGTFWGQQLRRIGRGEEPHFLQHSHDERPHMKSIGRSITGYHLCDDEETIKQTLHNLTTEVIYKTRRLGLAGRQVWVSLRGGNNGGSNSLGGAMSSTAWSRHATFKTFIRHTPEMFGVVYHQLYRSWQRSWPVIKCSVGLNLLEPWQQTPPVLWPEWHQWEQVETAVDALTKKYGLFVVRSGVLARAHLLRPEVTGFLGDKGYQLGRLG